jgi:hypothetical protein
MQTCLARFGMSREEAVEELILNGGIGSPIALRCAARSAACFSSATAGQGFAKREFASTVPRLTKNIAITDS